MFRAPGLANHNNQFFLALWIKGIILGNKILLEHVGLPHILDLAVYLVNFFGWMNQGDHSEPLLLYTHSY